MSDTEKRTVWNWVMSVGGSLALFWASFSFILQPVVEAVAKESFKSMMIAQGVDPKVFRELTLKVEQTADQVQDIYDDLKGAKAGLNKVILQTDSLEKTAATTNCLTQKLLNLQLGLPANPTGC